VTDYELLRRYAREGSEEAFAEIVRRHSALVYSTCLRILADQHEAEDASQAVFIALSRKARSFREGPPITAWLHRVAKCSALQVKRASQGRAKRERKVAEMKADSVPATTDERTWLDVRPVLDEALASLPGRYSKALVLRYLDSKSEREVAQELGTPVGTVSSLLSRGLDMLRQKLARSHVVLDASLLAALLAERTSEAVPKNLTEAIVAACTLEGMASAAAVSIAEETMRAIAIAKMKLAAVVVAVMVAVGAGGGLIAGALAADKEAPPAGNEAARPDKTRYVSTRGNDANDGCSEKTAWRTIAQAAGKAQAGDLVKIEAGNYGHENVLISNSGAEGSPIRFEGYGGDVVLEGVLPQKPEDDGEYGVMIKGAAYVVLSGITTIKYRHGIFVKDSHHIKLERCTVGLCRWGGINIGKASNNCEVRHCTAYNAGMGNIMVGGRDNIVADCWSYYNPSLVGWPGVDTKTDYCYSSANSQNVLFIRCRGDNATHGVAFTAGGGSSPGCKNGRVEDCEMYNNWELFGIRDCSSEITLVNCYGSNVGSKRSSDHGFYFYIGANNCVVKNCRVKGVSTGFHTDESENPTHKYVKGALTRNIVFQNCIATQCTYGFAFGAPQSKAVNCLSARNEVGVALRGMSSAVVETAKALGLSLEDKDRFSVKGCLVVLNSKKGIEASFPTAEMLARCNVWSNGTDYAPDGYSKVGPAGYAKPGADCSSVDPQFKFATKAKEGEGESDRDDWHLKETSPCKDIGPYADDPKAAIGNGKGPAPSGAQE
jgi:RNA polymerase sigma factor (sigma-70 family)